MSEWNEAIQKMQAASAPAVSAKKARTGAEMIAHHRFRLDADNNTAEVDSSGLAEEIDNALAALSATEGEAEPVATEDIENTVKWLRSGGVNAVVRVMNNTAASIIERLAAHPPSAPAGVKDDAREFVAKVVYSAMKWAAERAEKGTPPEWVERGNSLAQSEARRVARNITDYVTAALQPDTKSTREGSLAQSNLMDGWTAMRMIREAVETLGPIGAMPSEEHLAGPTFLHEAEAIVAGIMKMKQLDTQEVCCALCGDAGTITDRVDGEITCPECGYSQTDTQAAAASPTGLATWHPLDDDGAAELRVNGKRITSFPSYPAAEEAAGRINAALSSAPAQEGRS